MKRLVIIQRRLTHYRVPFFNLLRDQLGRSGVALSLGCGRGTEKEESKNDSGVLDWADSLRTKYFAGGAICYQSFGHLIKNADMLVVTAESKLINNLYYQYGSPSLRIGLWGHGANLQGDPKSFKERIKRCASRRADWWFGYTEVSRRIIRDMNFPSDRITILNNSVDTSSMSQYYEEIRTEDRSSWRTSRGVGAGPVGIFVGSLYREKRIDQLLASALELRSKLSGFELIVVGAGPEAFLVKEFARQHPWTHYLGPLHGRDKVEALASSDVLLNPGAVGLGVLDSFVCGVPLVTVAGALHGPEIAYIEDGLNGIVVNGGLDAFVGATASLLQSPIRHAAMSSACRASAQEFSISNMVDRFVTGVQSCLESPIVRGRSH
jgi:glycosyltransferase involved in cell wall biosynthesis